MISRLQSILVLLLGSSWQALICFSSQEPNVVDVQQEVTGYKDIMVSHRDRWTLPSEPRLSPRTHKFGTACCIGCGMWMEEKESPILLMDTSEQAMEEAGTPGLFCLCCSNHRLFSYPLDPEHQGQSIYKQSATVCSKKFVLQNLSQTEGWTHPRFKSLCWEKLNIISG